jgi:hypothetical protein
VGSGLQNVKPDPELRVGLGLGLVGLGPGLGIRKLYSVHSAFPGLTAHVGTILGLSSMGGGDFNM